MPTFEPHVTLLTGIATETAPASVLSQLSKAVTEYRLANPAGVPLSLQFTELDTHEPKFFQYLFAAVRPTPELLALRASVRGEVLGLDPASDDFFPHLSLAYGKDEGDREVREMIEELSAGQEAGDTVEVAGLTGFDVGEVQLVKCEGPPPDWEVVGRVSLAGPTA